MFGGQPTQQVAKGGKSAPARATISTGPCFVAVGARSVLGVAKLGWVLLVAAGGGGCLTDALPRPCVPAAAADQSEEEEDEEEEPLLQLQPTGAGQDDDADEDESEGEEDEIDVDAANKKAPGASKPAKPVKKFHWSKQTLWCALDCRLTELVRCRADTPLCPPLTRLCAPQIHKGATSAKDDALEQYEVDPVGFMHGRGENSSKSKWKLIGDQLVKEAIGRQHSLKMDAVLPFVATEEGALKGSRGTACHKERAIHKPHNSSVTSTRAPLALVHSIRPAGKQWRPPPEVGHKERLVPPLVHSRHRPAQHC